MVADKLGEHLGAWNLGALRFGPPDYHLMNEYLVRIAQWKKDRLVRWETTELKGFDKGVEAFVGLFTGENLGKMLVDV